MPSQANQTYLASSCWPLFGFVISEAGAPGWVHPQVHSAMPITSTRHSYSGERFMIFRHPPPPFPPPPPKTTRRVPPSPYGMKRIAAKESRWP